MNYILIDKEVTKVHNLMEWAKWFETADRVVLNNKVNIDGEYCTISTVFLGIDHNYDDGPPLLFETMVFGGEHDTLMKRYPSWTLAEQGHRKIRQMIIDGALDGDIDGYV